ncbi:acyltransferase family protein [Bifidobacterium imperatoris]|uniref:acyltransferase family protein n=1 Tax=Bifidobacterium imperatoris TaxID=2020965 RepID=UPI0024182A4A|nr:acyltransferase [Bifidobacterium imperatoris]
MDQYGGQLGVCIFFILSGYFLINKPFRIQRVVRTILQTFIYAILLFVVSLVLSRLGVIAMPMSLIREAYLSLLPTFNGTYWFITAYVALVLLSPVINAAFHNASRKTLAFALALSPVLSIMATVALGPVLWTNLTYAITAYLYGAYIRTYGKDMHIAKRLSPLAVAALILSSFVIVSAFYYVLDDLSAVPKFIHSSHHVTGTLPILPILSVSAIFLIIHNDNPSRHATKSPSRIRNVVYHAAKYVFGVYLIHENPCIKNAFWDAISRLLPPAPELGIAVVLFGVVSVLMIYLSLLLAAFIIDSAIVRPIEKPLMKAKLLSTICQKSN